MDKLALLFLTLLIWLQYSLWLGKNGLHDYSRVNNAIAIQKIANEKLKTRNSQLFSRINDPDRNQEILEECEYNQFSIY